MQRSYLVRLYINSDRLTGVARYIVEAEGAESAERVARRRAVADNLPRPSRVEVSEDVGARP